MNISRPASTPIVPPAETAAPSRVASRDGDAATPEAGGSLWDILTPEEREFFALSESLGPVTYRPGHAPAAAPTAPTGRRVDVRG